VRAASRNPERSGGPLRRSQFSGDVAERVGFEPTIPVKVYTLSKRAPSATRPSLRRTDQPFHYKRCVAMGLTSDCLRKRSSHSRKSGVTETPEAAVFPASKGIKKDR